MEEEITLKFRIPGDPDNDIVKSQVNKNFIDSQRRGERREHMYMPNINTNKFIQN